MAKKQPFVCDSNPRIVGGRNSGRGHYIPVEEIPDELRDSPAGDEPVSYDGDYVEPRSTRGFRYIP